MSFPPELCDQFFSWKPRRASKRAQTRLNHNNELSEPARSWLRLVACARRAGAEQLGVTFSTPNAPKKPRAEDVTCPCFRASHRGGGMKLGVPSSNWSFVSIVTSEPSGRTT